MTAHRVGLPGPETGRCQHHYRWGTIFHRRAFTNNADPKKGLSVFFPSPKKRESTLISRGFAAFVSSHLYSMSSHLDTKRNSLTSLSRCGTILRKSAPQTQKKEKDLSPDVSVIRRQAKKGDRLLGRASCVEQGLCAGVRFRAPRIGRVLHALRHSVYALGDRHRHAQLCRFPHHIAGHRLELGLAPGLDVLRHRAGVLRELRLPRFAAKAPRDSPAGTWSGPFPLVCFHTAKEILRARLPKKEKRSSIAHRRAPIYADQERGSEAKHGCRSDEEGADLRAGIGVMFRF